MFKIKDINKVIVYLLAIIIPISIVIYSIIILSSSKDLIFFPDKDLIVLGMNDILDNGISTVDSLTVKDNRVIFSYTLNKKELFPIYAGYANFQIYRGYLFSIKKYDIIKIKLKSLNAQSIYFYILLYLDNYTVIDKESTYLMVRTEIPLIKNRNDYEIKIKDLYIPEWWYAINISSSDIRIKKKYSQVLCFGFDNHIFKPSKFSDTIILEKITLTKDKNRIIINSSVILFIYFLIIIIFIILRYHKKRLIAKIKKAVIPFSDLNFYDRYDEDTSKLVIYLGKNYINPNITVEKTGFECGIPKIKIPILLKKVFNLTFPQYLNAIRIAEAKRLLSETDRQISDIAYNIGFKNASHFNYVFKSIEGLSPISFRYKYKKNHIF